MLPSTNQETTASPTPSWVFVVMGVSGSGKSAVAREASYQLGAACLDGDALHTRTSIRKMQEGIPLSDEDRQPWLTSLSDAIYAMRHTSASSVK